MDQFIDYYISSLKYPIIMRDMIVIQISKKELVTYSNIGLGISNWLLIGMLN